MLRRTAAACIASMMLLALTTAPAFSQDYPSKPIRVIVPFPPGGGTDFLARVVSNKLLGTQKWTMVVDNRAGANGTIGIGELARSPKQGYDIALGQSDNLAIAPWLYKGVTYNINTDLEAIAMVAESPVVLVASAASPYKTLQDVVVAAKAKPNSVTFGVPGIGSVAHLVGELLQSTAAIKLQAIPYKGSAPAMVDVMGGQIELMTSSIPSALSQIKSGKVRALAVSTAKRSPILPDVPTIAESGYPKFDVSVWYGFFGPRGLPADVKKKLNSEINAVLALPDVEKSIAEQGAVATPMTSEALRTRLDADAQKWKVVIDSAKIVME